MIDIPRLFTAVAEWGACVLSIYFLKKRFNIVKLIPLCVLWLAIICGWQYGAGYFPLVIWALGMTGAAVLMVLFVYCCCKVNFITAVYWGICSFIVAEFVASVEWELYYYLFVSFAFAAQGWFKYLWFVIIYAISFAVLWLFNKKFLAGGYDNPVSLKNLIAVVIIVLLCFVVSNLNFLYGSDGWTEQMTEKIFEIRTLVDLCGLSLLYTYRIMQDSVHHQAEKSAMHDILEKQYREYRQFKENDEAINRHYHDLKHQIDLILSEEDTEKRSKNLKEMKKSIKVRQSQTDTGNDVLDTLLTSKSLDCVQADITFTVVADGTLLGFMQTMDLCSVIGNALDNAIESVKKIENAEKRLIQLALFSQEGWVVLRIRNYFEQPLSYDGNEIITTKKDRRNHGYGLKSIRYVTEKYGGSMKVVTKNNWFTLCLLFPVDKSAKTPLPVTDI